MFRNVSVVRPGSMHVVCSVSWTSVHDVSFWNDLNEHERTSMLHPEQNNVSLMTDLVLKLSKPYGLVFEAFVGTVSTSKLC